LFLQLHDRVVIKIESVAFGGEGVGRFNNFVIFVPFAAPDDELEVEITQLKKKFARGKIVKIIQPSDARVSPLCRYYQKCGGCCYQHINYERQLKIKKRQVAEAFEKIGKIAMPPVLEVIASPKIYNYRGKAQLHVASANGECKIGFMNVDGDEIVDIEDCEIMENTINEKISAWRQDNQSPHDKNARVTIWSGFEAGKNEPITRKVKKKDFLVPPGGFFQANLYLTDSLVDKISRLAQLEDINTLIDAYCGSGLFSIFLANCAKNIIGIERDAKSIKYALINAANAHIKNVKFIKGTVEEILPGIFLPSKNKIDMIILDPPRTGCGEPVLNSVSNLRPRRIIYISCNPATQARDVRYLNEQGYELLSLMPIDMFPQTEHIETIGLLVIK
jgi:23S rRNA (uracil1939-C5)-methyltransferase